MGSVFAGMAMLELHESKPTHREIRFVLMVGSIAFLLLSAVVPPHAAAKNVFTRRWVKVDVNINSDEKVDSALSIMKIAAGAGYNLVRFQATGFPIMTKLGEPKLKRLRRAASETRKLGLHIMPGTFHQSEPAYADLQNAEGLPVKGTKFVVNGAVARAVDDSAYGFKNPGFESWHDNLPDMPKEWQPKGLTPGKELFIDKVIKHSGNASMRVEIPNSTTPALVQRIAIKPWRAYRISVWIKTSNVTRPHGIGVEVYHMNRPYLNPRGHRGVAANQNWRRYSWEFCSLTAVGAKFRLALTAHGWRTSGTVWFDDIEIHEVGLHNTLTRSTTPVTVRSESGKTYTEGTDYVVEKERLLIPDGSAIQSGDVLRVTWYLIADMDTKPATSSYCHNGSWQAQSDIVKGIFDNIGPIYGWFIKFCEWRVSFWDPACHAQHRNAGEYMGWVAKRSVQMLREFNPKIETIIGNATFDPYHNALESYYMVNGSVHGSWSTMDSATIVGNWHAGRKDQSVRFFAGKDTTFPTWPRKQAFSVQQGHVGPWLDLLDRLESEYGDDVKDMFVGVGYVTWGNVGNNFSNIVSMAETCRRAGRWGKNPCPFENGCNYPLPGIRNATPQGAVPQGVAFRRVQCTPGSGMRIEYVLSHKDRVRISVLNIKGQEIQRIVDRFQTAGQYVVQTNLQAAAGVYFVRLSADGIAGGKLVERMVRL